MTARKLGLLSVLGLENIADAVEELHIALLRIRLNSRDKCPRHGTRCLSINRGIGAVVQGKYYVLEKSAVEKLTKSDRPCYQTT